MAKTSKDTGLTLDDIRWLHADAVAVLCMTCPHQTVINIEGLSNFTSLASLAAGFVCEHCGGRGADLLPRWAGATVPSPKVAVTETGLKEFATEVLNHMARPGY
jgi:hypothetical protein